MHHAHHWLAAPTLAAALALAGCGSGHAPADGHDGAATGADHAHGEGADHGHAEHGEAEHDEVPLGTASIGDLQVECWQGHGSLAAGEESHLVVKLPYSDQGATEVRAWIGTEDRLQSLVGLGEYAAGHDDYDVHAEAPDPLPADPMWWIEITAPDGTVSVGSIAPQR